MVSRGEEWDGMGLGRQITVTLATYGCDPECWSRGVLIVSMATSLTTQDLVSLSFHFSSTSLFC